MISRTISDLWPRSMFFGVLLVLSWTCHAGTILVSPTTADAGTVGLQLTSHRKIMYSIKNTGTTNLSLISVTSASGEFKIDQPTGAQLPTIIPPGAGYSVVVSFRPIVAGSRSGIITIVSDDSLNPSITLTGTGYGGTEQSIRLAPAIPFEVEINQGLALRANVTFDNGANGVALLNWTSSNPAIVGVSSGADSLVFGTAVPTGKLLGLGLGSSTISVSGVTNPSATAAVNVTVVPTSKFDFMATTFGDQVLRVTDGTWSLCYDFPEVGPNSLPVYETNIIGVTTLSAKINNAYVTAQAVNGTSPSAEQIFYINDCNQRSTIFDPPLSSPPFRDLAVDSSGNAVASSADGLWRMNPVGSSAIPLIGLPANTIGALAFDTFDNLYAANLITNASTQASAVYELPFGTTGWSPIAVLFNGLAPSNARIINIAVDSTQSYVKPYVMKTSENPDRVLINRFFDINIDGSYFKIVGGSLVPDPSEIVEIAAIDAGTALTLDADANLFVSVAETEGKAIVKLTDKNNDGDYKDANESKVVFQSSPYTPLKDVAFAAPCNKAKAPTPIITTSPPDGVSEIGVSLSLIGDGSVSPCGDVLRYEWTDENIIPPKLICSTAYCPFVCAGLPHLHKLGLRVTDSRGNSAKSITTIKCGPPQVNGFWPTYGVTNSIIFFFGKNFKVASGKIPTACFNNGALCTPLVQVVAPDLLLALQPYGATFGIITITTDMGMATTSQDYPIIDGGFRIYGIWPSEISAGGIVLVFGNYFGLSPGSNIVDVNGVPAPLVHVLDSGLMLIVVPSGASTGPVHVTTNGVTATSSVPLAILP